MGGARQASSQKMTEFKPHELTMTLSAMARAGRGASIEVKEAFAAAEA